MNTPNPLVPQGSIPSRGKSTVRIAFFTIAAIHVVFIGGLLMQGCKKPEEKPVVQEPAPQPIPPFVEPTSNTPPANVATTTASNPPPYVAPLPTTLEPPAPPASEYVVAKGDTFSTIAKKAGVSVKAIEQANPGVSSSKLKIGQKLQLPASGGAAPVTASSPAPTDSSETAIYVVKAGDMLEKIAKRHGTTAKTIMRLNNMKTTMIKPGQKLKLPAPKTASSAPLATPDSATPPPAVLIK